MQAMRLVGIGLLLAVLASVIVTVRDTPAASYAGAIPVGVGPLAVAVDSSSGHAFVANNTDGSVSMLDTRSGVVVRTIAVGPQPREVTVDAHTGRAFVLGYQAAMTVLDTTSGAILRTSAVAPLVPFMGDGGNVAVDAVSDRVFVDVMSSKCLGAGTVSVLDASSGAVLGVVTVGKQPEGLAVDAHTGRAFVANRIDNTVSVLDASNGHVLRTISVGSQPNGVAVDERTGRAFVTNFLNGTVSMLDARSGAVLRTLAVGTFPSGMAVDARTGRIFVLTAAGASILDAQTGRVLHTVTAGRAPSKTAILVPAALAVDTDRNRAFIVVNLADTATGHEETGNVRVLDATSARLLRRVPVGQSPVAAAVDERTGHLFVVNHDGGGAIGAAGSAHWPKVWGWLPQRMRDWLAPASSVNTTTGGTVSMLNLSN